MTHSRYHTESTITNIYQRLPYVVVFFGKTMCTNLVLCEIIDIFAEL